MKQLQLEIQNKILQQHLKQRLPIIFRGKLLNYNSDISLICQYIAEKYYHKPYSQDPRQNGVQRPLHGAVHAISAVLLVPFFIEIWKTFYDGMEFSEWLELSDKHPLLKCLKLAVLCHDAANVCESMSEATQEERDELEKKQALIFISECFHLGFDQVFGFTDWIEKLALAMATKDNAEDIDIGDELAFPRMIIHDTDCLEILRCLSDSDDFRLEELHILKWEEVYNEDKRLGTLLRKRFEGIVVHYHSLMTYLYQSTTLHQQCEHAQDCYSKLLSLYDNFRVIKHLNSNSMEYSEALLNAWFGQYLQAISNLTPLERYHFSSVRESIFRQLLQSLNDLNMPFGAPLSLESYHSDGVYLRRFASLSKEYAIYALNEANVASKNIKTIGDLRQYVSQLAQNREGQSSLMLRPAQWLHPALQSRDIAEQYAGFLFNAKTTLVHSRYKRNAFSDDLNEGKFSYHRTNTRVKDYQDHGQFVEKLMEMESRRRGSTDGSYHDLYGDERLPHNEVLLFPSASDLMAVVVGSDPQSLNVALFYTLLTARTRRAANIGLLPIMVMTAKGPLALSFDDIKSFLKNPDAYTTGNIKVQPGLQERLCSEILSKHLGPLEGVFWDMPVFREPIYCRWVRTEAAERPLRQYCFELKSSLVNWTCYAWVKQGRPVLEVDGYSENRLTIADAAQWVHKISFSYLKQQTYAYQCQLERFKAHYSALFGVSDLKVSLDVRPVEYFSGTQKIGERCKARLLVEFKPNAYSSPTASDLRQRLDPDYPYQSKRSDLQRHSFWMRNPFRIENMRQVLAGLDETLVDTNDEAIVNECSIW